MFRRATDHQQRDPEGTVMDDARSESRSAPPPDLWFLGDLNDPWVAEIADALPAVTSRVDCPGDLPDTAFGPSTPGPAGVLVLHRSVLGRHDVERLKALRSARTPSPRVILCYGPHVRYDDLIRWGHLFDVALPEATARDTIARHVAEEPASLHRYHATTGSRLSIVSSNVPLRQMLADACELAGYSVASARDWSTSLPDGPAVWDVPLLDPEWPAALARRSRLGPVIALIGFADRGLVAEARARGAAVCLELPLDLVDLSIALERASALWKDQPRSQQAHETPPAPAASRVATARRAVADRRDDS